MKPFVILVALCAIAHAQPRAEPLGFDHLLHDRNIIVGGGEAMPCATCHVQRAGKLVGKPDHGTCFGKCHGPAPKRGAKLDRDRMKVCTACHAEAALVTPGAKLTVAYPPYAIERDFNLALGHKQHAQIACTQCHPARPVAPHQRCAGCHDGIPAAPMSNCARCHPPAVGRPQPPELAALHDTVGATFSHAKHAARGAAGKDCMTCHASIPTTNDSELPRPTVKDCAGCHDGKTAFATTEACTRCHADTPAKFEVARPDKRFRHGVGRHAELLAAEPCGACHKLSAAGEPQAVGHAACATCHRDDFGLRKPTICGACHTATEPWRHLASDVAPLDISELGATLDHGKHATKCDGCHSLRTPAQQLRTPRGHRACTGAGCHQASAGPAPRLSECAGCHQLGLAAARLDKREADPWSVRRLFDHRVHAGACTDCHVDLSATRTVDLATPPKRTCAGCHDGARAFSLSGTACTRCHPGKKR